MKFKTIVLLLVAVLMLTGCAVEEPVNVVEEPAVTEEVEPEITESDTITIDVSKNDVKERLEEIAEKFDMKGFNATIELVESEEPYLLVFETKYCEACRAYLPNVFEYMNSEGSYEVYNVNLDDEAALPLAREFNIDSTPTTIKIEDGKEVARVVGLISVSEIVENLH